MPIGVLPATALATSAANTGPLSCRGRRLSAATITARPGRHVRPIAQRATSDSTIGTTTENRSLCDELSLNELAVKSGRANELVMRTAVDDAALIEDDHTVYMRDGR